MRIGILALQGDFAAHYKMLEACGLQPAEIVEVRGAGALQDCEGLIIPGGESTVMSRLCDRFELWEPLRQRLDAGMGVFGTCAGLIFMAKSITGSSANFIQKTLGGLDIDVARNAYGAQLDSFESNVDVPLLGPEPLRAVFIRAPRITRVGQDVEVLAHHDGAAVVVRSGNRVGAAFHPEIAGDNRLHGLWLDSLGV